MVIRQQYNKGSCLKQDEITYTHGIIVNIYIVYEISKHFNISTYSTLENCLFGAVSLTKNADIDKYKYSGYGIGFDRHGFFLILVVKLVQIFGVNMSSPTKIDNKKKDIVILAKGPTQGLEHSLSAEKMYSSNFTEINKKSCLSLHYHGANSYVFVNGREINTFKANYSEIVATLLCLGNTSKDWTLDNINKNRLN